MDFDSENWGLFETLIRCVYVPIVHAADLLDKPGLLSPGGVAHTLLHHIAANTPVL